MRLCTPHEKKYRTTHPYNHLNTYPAPRVSPSLEHSWTILRRMDYALIKCSMYVFLISLVQNSYFNALIGRVCNCHYEWGAYFAYNNLLVTSSGLSYWNDTSIHSENTTLFYSWNYAAYNFSDHIPTARQALRPQGHRSEIRGYLLLSLF